MRTINKKMFQRLAAQAEEAKTLNLTKLAGHLDKHVLEKTSTRENEEGYTYTHAQMREDVERFLWDATVRVADYLGTPFDALQTQTVIEKLADDLIEEMQVATGNASGVGPYDERVPGEGAEQVLFELEVSDD